MLGVDPITRECRYEYPALFHGGERRPSSIRYIVLHTTESGSAESTARYFHAPGAGGSANLVVDWRRCYRCLGENVIPYAAPPLNTLGFHIEQAGFAAWPRRRWLLPHNRQTIRRAAYKAAIRCRWYQIPPRLLDVDELLRDFGPLDPLDRGHVPVQHGPLHGGIVTHRTVSETYRASTHTDPGAGYPLDLFMRDLHRYLGSWRPTPRLAAHS